MQNYKKVPLEQGIIDSLTIKIEFSQVQIIDSRLISDTQKLYIDTAEIDNERERPKPQYFDKHGIKYRIALARFSPQDNRECIEITLTSKMTKRYYWLGINWQTLPIILNTINESQIIKTNFCALLQASCNDIDICQNYKIEYETYKAMFPQIIQNLLEAKKHALQPVKRQKAMSIDKNLGIALMKRNQATVSLPHVTIYNKGHEIITNSLQFYETFLKSENIDFQDVVRKEVTIKNYALKQNLIDNKMVGENKLKTLTDVLNLNNLQLTEINNFIPKTYFMKSIKQNLRNSELTSTDDFLLVAVQMHVENGKSKKEFLERMPNYSKETSKGRKQKQRFIQKVDYIFSILESEDYLLEKSKKNDLVYEALKKMQLW